MKSARDLTLHDLLSRLRYADACKLLGRDGAALMREGGKLELDPSTHVELLSDVLRVRAGDAEVLVQRSEGARGRLALRCSECETACVHAGAALSVVLEEKLLLGLAAAPAQRVPVESLSEDQLVERALADRAERAKSEKMRMRSESPSEPWTDYTLTSAASGKSYRVALRGEERGVSYCSCPDFRKNTLGTCKHILYVLDRARRRFSAAQIAKHYRRTGFSLYLRYAEEVELRLAPPARMPPAAARIAKPILERPIDDLHDLVQRVRKLERAGHDVRVYPDAETLIDERSRAERLAALTREIRARPAKHPLRRSLLKTELLPYQLDGVAFAVGARRAILADDMGLGKTIQAIGAAELFAREAGVARVLVVCPTSLKAQWRREIERFSHRSVQLVAGSAAERARQYERDAFFTICNYEQVLRDLMPIERAPWDLIVLDEGQRIKNWEAKTSRTIKSLRSRYLLVLSGTPLENRLDDLYSVIEAVDDRRLGPAFRFMNRHRVVDERGRVLGYKNLDELRQRLRPVLLRRTRAEVLAELPVRTVEMVRITPTEEQLELHGAHMRIVNAIVRKPYLTEMDLLRLQKALMMCRMAADSTYLVDKKAPGYSSKLEELAALIERLGSEDGRKVVLFSEWTTMLGLIEPLLKRAKIGYTRLDGSVPQKKRADIVRRFDRDPRCQFFLATNAGSTGLNLQVADTVINVDLPWNPAVLEQRIARVHRMGQTRPVQVFVLVTDGTIEESLLATLSSKHQLALAALDPESDVDSVTLESGIEELRGRLETLLGARADAPVDQTEAERVSAEAEQLARRTAVSEAAGRMLAGALELLGQLVPAAPQDEASRRLESEIGQRLAECVERDERGVARLTLTLPAAGGAQMDALASMARSLARLATMSSV